MTKCLTQAGSMVSFPCFSEEFPMPSFSLAMKLCNVCALYSKLPALAGAHNADPLDEILAELEVDPLDALIAELERIEGHETTLQDAVANNKAVVVHPRPEVMPVNVIPSVFLISHGVWWCLR